MGILDLLFGKTPATGDAIPDFDIQIGEIRLNKETLDPATYREIKRQIAEHGSVDLTITLPDDDPDDADAENNDGSGSGTSEIGTDHLTEFWSEQQETLVDPIFCMIDYVDSRGTHSRRRITIRKITATANFSWLWAYCHEREQPRRFRTDRISHFITHDGEVISPTEFLATMCDFSGPTTHVGATSKRRRTANFSRYTSPAVLVLTAMAMADNELHREEAEVILVYLENEAIALFEAGTIEAIPDVSTFDVIGRRIRRLRPTREDVAAALTELRRRPAHELNRLRKCIARVALADGDVRLSEEMFMADFDQLLASDDESAWKELSRMASMR